MFQSFPEIMRALEESRITSPSLRPELEWLFNSAHHVATQREEAKIVDLGTLNGSSAMVMGAAVQHVGSGHVFSLDDFSVRASRRDAASDSIEGIQLGVSKLGLQHVVTLLTSDDIVYLGACPDRSISMLFVDTRHAQDHVAAVLEAAMSKMEDESLICGHDYSWPQRGVVYAVEQWRRDRQQELCGFGTHYSIWWSIVRIPHEV